MDMKKLLSKLDAVSTKPAVNGDDMKKFINIVTESTKPITNVTSQKSETLLEKYIKKQENINTKKTVDKRKPISEQARRICDRLRLKEESASIYDIYEDPDEIETDVDSEEDPVDAVTIDVPLLIRLLEYAREDAETDMDLHNVTEMLINLSKEHDTLSMDQYDQIVGDQKKLVAPSMEQ